MDFPTPLVPARLIRRYKRFLADMVLEDGREVTVHCPNPGAMTGLSDPGTGCWLAPARPGAKLPWGWKLAQTATGMAVIDTGIANRVVAEALAARRIPGLPAYDAIRPEAMLDKGTRIDFCLTTVAAPLWLEVKSVTLARNGRAEFPDSRTARGTRHLEALATAAARGEGAVMLYLLARNDCARVAIAGDIDPAYSRAFERARAAGVQMIGLATTISPAGVHVAGPVPVL